MNVYVYIGKLGYVVFMAMAYAFMWPALVVDKPDCGVDESDGRALVGLVGTFAWIGVVAAVLSGLIP